MRLSDGQSLLQKTLNRILKSNMINEVITVTNREFYFKTKDEYSNIINPSIRSCFILEPFGRNTAAAIGMAALFASLRFGLDTILLILPADHLIEQQADFTDAVKLAYDIAQADKLVTFGIKPTFPETGYGYIKQGQPLIHQPAYTIEKFIEKPELALAEEYLDSQQYLWNSGIFCFKSDVILEKLEQFSPAIFQAIHECFLVSNIDSLPDTFNIDSKSFHVMPDLSIDYAVMEKAENSVVIPCTFSWKDIGSWSAVSELVNPDEAGNRVVGEALLFDVKNSFIQSEERLVAAVGIENLIIVDTVDALLVADCDRSQEVKNIVDKLKQNNHACYKIHRTVMRPWGTYTTLEEGSRFKIKRIVVKPGASLSLQMHHHRSEHWVVVSGVAKVTNGDDKFMLHTNESTFIKASHQHRLENPGLLDLVLIEVQTGEYLGEDDIVRYDDRYGREINTENIM